MSFKQAVFGLITLAYIIVSGGLMPSVAQAPDAKVKTAMETLRSKAAKLGPPKIEGVDAIAGKQVPAIYFGSTKQNNDFALVDEVVKEVGGTATIFVKSGETRPSTETWIFSASLIRRDMSPFGTRQTTLSASTM